MPPEASAIGLEEQLRHRIEALERELVEGHRREEAMADILKVIASSPSDVQPVFDAIVSACKRLFDAHAAVLSVLVGDKLHLAAYTTVSPEADRDLQQYFPRQLNEAGLTTAAIRARVVQSTSDAEESAAPPQAALARRRGFKSLLVAPMLRGAKQSAR